MLCWLTQACPHFAVFVAEFCHCVSLVWLTSLSLNRHKKYFFPLIVHPVCLSNWKQWTLFFDWHVQTVAPCTDSLPLCTDRPTANLKKHNFTQGKVSRECTVIPVSIFIVCICTVELKRKHFDLKWTTKSGLKSFSVFVNLKRENEG